MKVYLDNAATTPITDEVFDAMHPYLQSNFGNPSSQHSYGRTAKSAVEESRRKIAKIMGVTPGEIIFTSGGSEADNLALNSAVCEQEVTRIITSKTEHHAVLNFCEYLKLKKIDIVYLGCNSFGQVDLSELEELLRSSDEKTLVSLMYANNEVGTLLDFNKTASLCETYGALFHSDTVQAIGHYALDLGSVNIDYAAASAHKFHGPKGVGFLFRKQGSNLQPLIFGGAQERGQRAGTENVASIVGMAKALDAYNQNRIAYKSHILSLKNYLQMEVTSLFQDAKIVGATGEDALYTVLNVGFPKNSKTEMLLFNLDIEGVAVSGGSACASGSSKGSHVMDALGVESNRVQVRFSFSHLNTREELIHVVEVLKKILN